jgi:WD40 repeat protein
VWDAQSGAALQTLEGHSDWVSSVAFSPDGLKIVSGSNDSAVRVWDAQSGEALQTLEGHSGEVNSVAFSPEGSLVRLNANDHWVTWCQKGVIYLPENRQVARLALYRNKLVIGSRSGIVTLFEIDLDGECYI